MDLLTVDVVLHFYLADDFIFILVFTASFSSIIMKFAIVTVVDASNLGGFTKQLLPSERDTQSYVAFCNFFFTINFSIYS